MQQQRKNINSIMFNDENNPHMISLIKKKWRKQRTFNIFIKKEKLSL